jgi:hypothetical protein
MARRSLWSRRLARLTVVGLMATTVPLTAAAPAAAAPAPVTSVTMVSETGDYIGGGISQLFHPGNGSVSLSGSPGYVSVSVSGGTHGAQFSLDVAAPPGEALAAGEYVNAQRAAFREAGRPGLDIGGDGRGCNTLTGRFTVLDIATSGDVVDRLHVLYEQHCEGGDSALYGEIRYRATGGDTDLLVAPAAVSWPIEYPGVRGRPVPVTVVNTSTGRVTVGTPQVTGSAFAVVSNTCSSALAKGGSCTVHVTFTPPAPGEHVGELALPTSTSAGTRRVALSGEGETGTTSWTMRGDPGDYITGGQSFSWTPANARINGRGSEAYVAIGVEAADGYFTAEFAPGRNDILLPGVTYENARRYPFHDPSPGLSVSGSGRGCNTLTGRFTVHEITFADGGLNSFKADFEQHCEGGEAALYGSISLRAGKPVPTDPEPSEPAPSEPTEPEPTDPEPTEPEPTEPEPTEPAPLTAQASPAARPVDDSCPEDQVPPAGFTDVVAGSVHGFSIDCLVWWEVVRGRTATSYAPAADVTRGQMATFIANALRQSGEVLPEPARDYFFDDNGSVHEDSTNRLAQAGIVSGRGGGRYAPLDPVGRGAMTKFLVLAYEYTAREQVPSNVDYYGDDAGTTFEQFINAATAVGFATGYPDGYRPDAFVRRDQMASFIARWLDLVVERVGAQ